MTRPAATTGACPLPASRRVTQYYAGNSLPPLPAGSVRGALLENPYPLHPSIQKFRSIERALLVVNTAAALLFAVFLLFAPL